MKTGTLTVMGTLELNQFWPHQGQSKFDSDADTIHVKITGPIEFRDASGVIKQTSALDDAGFWRKTKVRRVIHADKTITVRLQGIDAPELHYQIRKPLHRQRMGQTCTVELRKMLSAQAVNGVVPCTAFTRVNKPNEVFDIYGRFVGDVVVTLKNGKRRNLNQWLIGNGYAFPSFYDSMLEHEIRTLRTLATQPRKMGLNTWRYYSNQMVALDRTLVHIKASTNYNSQTDRQSPVINPKLFRRLHTFEIDENHVFTTQGFHNFLEAKAKGSNDHCYETVKFLSGQKGQKQKLSRFVQANGQVSFLPHELVFTERPTSNLKNSQKKNITTF